MQLFCCTLDAPLFSKSQMAMLFDRFQKGGEFIQIQHEGLPCEAHLLYLGYCFWSNSKAFKEVLQIDWWWHYRSLSYALHNRRQNKADPESGKARQSKVLCSAGEVKKLCLGERSKQQQQRENLWFQSPLLRTREREREREPAPVWGTTTSNSQNYTTFSRQLLFYTSTTWNS